jgi:predicted nucleotidyltransferase
MKSIRGWKKRIPGTEKVLTKIRKTVNSIRPDADVILYGSRARGDMENDSDWDILILLNDPVDRQVKNELSDALYETELETNEVFSSIIRTKEEWNSPRYSVLPFKKNVEEEGILL